MISDETLSKFWQMAAAPVPLVILGGGRWGRVWAGVLTDARGSGRRLTLVARSNPQETRAWACYESGIPELTVCESLEAALALDPALEGAIVATRPRDHVQDAMAVLQRGLDVLLEKPLCERAERGQALLDTARSANRLLAVATEFSFLPAFHCCARAVQAEEGIKAVRLFWDDSARDIRHGAPKRLHDEISVLVDVLPHAYSIFRIFAGRPRFNIARFDQDIDRERGWLEMRDETKAAYMLRCDRRAPGRRRLLQVESARHVASVDFATAAPKLVVDGKALINTETLYMNSTLRLELGAFLSERSGAVGGSPITDSLQELLTLQAVVEGQRPADFN